MLIFLLAVAAAPIRCPSRTDSVAVPGGMIYVEECGRGRPIVLLHGGNLDRRMWDKQFARFALHYRIVRYDARGFGRSRGQQAPYSASDDLEAVLDSRGIRQAALVGLSLGGRIALDFAVQHPERVVALVLSGPGLSGFAWSATPDPAFIRIRRALDARDSVGAALGWLEHPYMVPATKQARLRAPLRRLAVENASSWIQPDRERMLEPPAISRLAGIRAPVLLLIGSLDVPDIHRIVDTLAKSIPGAVRIDVGGFGHMLNMEAPDRFDREVLRFLAPHLAPTRSDRSAGRGSRWPARA